MPHKKKIFLSAIFLIIGILLCAMPIALVDDFIEAARPIIMMGAGFQSGGFIFESVVLIILLFLIFGLGLALIILSIRHMRKSPRKARHR